MILKRFTEPTSHIPFYVICEDNGRFGGYDVMPYFIQEYNDAKQKPETPEQWKDWFESTSGYMYWARCQYEIIIKDWPCDTKMEKIDVHEQLLLNEDIVIEIIKKNVGI